MKQKMTQDTGRGTQEKGEEGIMRWGFVACVAVMCWALGCWEMDEEATYAAEEKEMVIGDRWSVIGGDGECRHETQKCQLCGREIKWIPLPCECCWPPREMDEQNWSAVRREGSVSRGGAEARREEGSAARQAVEIAGSVPLGSNLCMWVMGSNYTNRVLVASNLCLRLPSNYASALYRMPHFTNRITVVTGAWGMATNELALVHGRTNGITEERP